MLTLKNVSKSMLNNKIVETAVENINLIIRPTDFISISGNNGAGKTALLSIISLEDVKFNGEYYIDGIELSKYTPKQILDFKSSRFCFAPTVINMDGKKTILQNFLITTKNIKISRSEKIENIKRLLTDFDLDEDVLIRKASSVSCGTIKLLGLIFKLACPFKTLFLDDPTALLDEQNENKLIDYLCEINKEQEIAIIVATNNERLCAKAKRFIVVENGKMVELAKGAAKKQTKTEKMPSKKKRTASIKKEVIIPTVPATSGYVRDAEPEANNDSAVATEIVEEQKLVAEKKSGKAVKETSKANKKEVKDKKKSQSHKKVEKTSLKTAEEIEDKNNLVKKSTPVSTVDEPEFLIKPVRSGSRRNKAR